MSNCTVAPARSTKIPVAASTGRGGTTNSSVAKGINAQSGSVGCRKSIHTIIAVTPRHPGLQAGRRLSTGAISVISSKKDTDDDNSSSSRKNEEAEEEEEEEEYGRVRRGSDVDSCNKSQADDLVSVSDDNASAASYPASDDLHESIPSSFVSTSPSSSTSSPRSTSSSSLAEKQTDVGLQTQITASIPCENDHSRTPALSNGLNNQVTIDGRTKVAVS
ncbi:hypothetical protein BsWGS_13305 [Bradybaena similaris]